MFKNREIKATLLIAFPIIVGNLSQMALGIIDSMMVGQLGKFELAAMSFANSILSLPFVIGIGFAVAVSPLTAAENGQKNYKGCAQILLNALLLCFLITLALSFGVYYLSFHLDFLKQNDLVQSLSEPYIRIVGWSILPMILFLAMKQFADGLEKTNFGLWISIGTIPLNVFLNWLLIFGNWGFEPMGLSGAAWATFISRFLALVVMAWVILKHTSFKKYTYFIHKGLKVSRDKIRKVANIGLPGSMQYLMETSAFSISAILIGWFSPAQLAAHQIAISLASVTFMVAIGFSVAGSIRVGNAFGQKNMPLTNEIGKGTLVIAAINGLVFCIVLILARYFLAELFTQDTGVIEFATTLTLLAGLFQVSDSIQACAVGILRGIEDVKRPTIYVFIAYWVIGLPLGCLLGFQFGMESKGIWIGLIAGLSISAILLSHRFIKITSVEK